MKKWKWAMIFFCISIIALWVWRYTSLNSKYAEMFHLDKVVFELGEKVPFGTDYLEMDMQADGYWLRVNDFEVMPYDEYMEDSGVALAQIHMIPDRIALIHVTLFNEDSSAEGVMLTQLILHGYDSYASMNWDVLTAVNPILEGNHGIRLLQGSECELILPFNLVERYHKSCVWENLDNYTFFLRITSFPTKKDISLQ